MYEGRQDAWDRIWTYRRIKGHGEGPSVGDLSLQNWGFSLEKSHGGNDYPFGYLLLSKEATAAQRDNWQGGIDLTVLAAAEERALAWHHWFKQHAPAPIKPEQIRIRPDVLGTGHGLAKLPYIRDTRRSIGLDGFVLKLGDLVGNPADKTGKRFEDRVALGAYPADVHPLAACDYPDHTSIHHDTKPFYIPFRALTHETLGNLLVAGKTMAQSFMANSATRLHPIEWATGTAAGTIAAWAYTHQADTRGCWTISSKCNRSSPNALRSTGKSIEQSPLCRLSVQPRPRGGCHIRRAMVICVAVAGSVGKRDQGG